MQMQTCGLLITDKDWVFYIYTGSLAYVIFTTAWKFIHKNTQKDKNLTLLKIYTKGTFINDVPILGKEYPEYVGHFLLEFLIKR